MAEIAELQSPMNARIEAMAVFTSELYPSRDALDDGKYTKILTRLSRSRRAISSSTRDASNRRTRLGPGEDEDKDKDKDEGPVIRGYEGDEDEDEDEGRASAAGSEAEEDIILYANARPKERRELKKKTE